MKHDNHLLSQRLVTKGRVIPAQKIYNFVLIASIRYPPGVQARNEVVVVHSAHMFQ
jgi:hypothetical protein